MSLRAFRDLGALGEHSQVLGVGAGAEATLFWLTNHTGHVHATDLYGDEWGEQAPAAMLTDPGRYAPCAWNADRLTVERMDALDLRYDAQRFDGVFSASAIEHFGDHSDVRRALAEMHRVLKPGGIAALSTEYRIAGEIESLPGTLFFDHAQLQSLFDPTLWEHVEPIDLSVSDATLATLVDFDQVVADVQAGREWTYPHIVLRHSLGVTWTSVHVAVRRLG